MKLDEDSLKLDQEKAVNRILRFIKGIVEDAGASGLVIGLSGGVDSSLAATLCVRALGSERVLGIIMPTAFTPREDIEDAVKLAENLGIRTEIIHIDRISEAFFKALKLSSDDTRVKIPMANIRARIRMVILYYFANVNNYLVVGTGDRSEALIGYFTKYGDGGADFSPIRHLYKTQVRELARYVGIPERIASKPSSPQLYPGHKVTDEIPLDYDKLDLVLVGIFDYKMPPEKIAEATGTPLSSVKGVMSRFDKTRHKRMYPPMVEPDNPLEKKR